jgi:hypothetical protein
VPYGRAVPSNEAALAKELIERNRSALCGDCFRTGFGVSKRDLEILTSRTRDENVRQQKRCHAAPIHALYSDREEILS